MRLLYFAGLSAILATGVKGDELHYLGELKSMRTTDARVCRTDYLTEDGELDERKVNIMAARRFRSHLPSNWYFVYAEVSADLNENCFDNLGLKHELFYYELK